MADSWIYDWANFSGLPDDFSLENLDLSLESLEDVDPAVDWDTKFKDLEPPSVFLPNFPPDISSANDIKPVKVEGTSVLQNESPELKKSFRTSSPVSVLDNNSSSSCSAEIPTRRPRSKGVRSQRRTYEFFHRLFAGERRFHPVAPLNSETESNKKKNLTAVSRNISEAAKKKQPVINSKCSHCGVTHTPQWREGPMGPKTLCNACGVRHRSGRLFPEYRPAGSPTFVPELHSNSHRKVLEMRMKASSSNGP